MTNRNTKRALMMSCLSLLLCISMLVGSTFAWFTDTDTTVINNIVAGTLDIEIVDPQGNELENMSFVNVDGSSDILWEPNATFATNQFYLKNVGNLWLKFKVAINNTEISYNKLNEVITFTLCDATTGEAVDLSSLDDTSLEPNSAKGPFIIKGHMDENAGNEYQGLTLTGVSITVYATQYTSEKDMYNDQYDAEAPYDDEIITVVNADEFVAAFANLENGAIITLLGDIDMTGKAWTPVNNKSFTLNGNGYTVTGLGNGLVGHTGSGEITIKNVTFDKMTAINTYESATQIYAGLIGDADTCSYILMENVTISNSTISSGTAGDGKGYAAGFVAYTTGYGNDNDGAVNASHNFVNCSLVNTTVTGTSSAGGLVGHCGGNDATTTNITNFTSTNSTVTGEKNAKDGNMIGTAHVGVIYITDADIIVEADIGRFVPGNTGKLVINGEEQVAFTNELAYTTVPKTEESILASDVKEIMKTEGIVDFGGADVDYVYGGVFNASVIKNLNSNGFYTVAVTQDIVFEDCTFTGNPYAFQVDNGNNHSITFKNCTFKGWVSFAATVSNVAFENCTFDKSSYGVVRFYQNGSFTNCTFTENFEWADTCVDGITVTVTNCTGLTTDKIFYNEGTSAHWIVDGTELTTITTH